MKKSVKNTAKTTVKAVSVATALVCALENAKSTDEIIAVLEGNVMHEVAANDVATLYSVSEKKLWYDLIG